MRNSDAGSFGDLSWTGNRKPPPQRYRQCLGCGCDIRIHGGKLRCIPCAEAKRMEDENNRRRMRRLEKANGDAS